MQMHTKYIPPSIGYWDVFEFFIHIPVAVFDELTDEQMTQDCYEMLAVPTVIIRDQTHPLFIEKKNYFAKTGITKPLIAIILAVGYNKPFLS